MDSRHRNSVVGFVLVAVAGGLFFERSAAAQEPLSPAAVLGAIERGKAYLKREQSPNGLWQTYAGQEGGVTALCTLALLNSGLDAADPTVKRSLDWLAKADLDKTYSVALQTMALCVGDAQKHRLKIDKCVARLVKSQIREGRKAGAWAYGSTREGGGDPSNAQFAVLALYEAQRIGARVDAETWRLANRYWRGIQNADGSWSYPGQPATGSMTCAGVGALAIIADAIGEGDARVENGAVRCCVEQANDDAIERGVSWLGRNFSVQNNPGLRGAWHYYYLYALERVGRLTARRFIGAHDWYREGTEYLVRSQDRLAHYWKGRAFVEESNTHIATAMALLFLSKGRRPLLLAKLEHGADNGWNAHRRDADHLTRHAERAWELDLTWQTVSGDGASVDDLIQAPVVYVSGSRGADLAPYAQKLRGYVDRGGFVFAEACCGAPGAFRRSVEELVERMFPEPEYRLRQLRPQHPIWRMDVLVRPDSPYVGSLWAVEYGCRTCLVFCDRDLSCYWELDRPQRATRYPAPVEQQVDDATAVGLNVLAYATNREPRGKEQAFVDEAADALLGAIGERGVIRVAKLRHGGGCNDAPAALANLARVARGGEARVQLAAAEGLVGIGDDAFFDHHLSFMHGRHNFRLTPAERRRLRQYLVENDGLLLADSICASPAFTRAFRRELLASLAGYRLEQIPEGDPIFTPEYGGFDIRRVTLRDPAPEAAGQPVVARNQRVAPRLEGVKVDGTWRVVFSPYDLSCALERREAVECRGYSREDAARIGLNVLLYSINQ